MRTEEENRVIDEFHKLHYDACVAHFPRIFNVPIEKSPLDLWVYLEIIMETKPDFIIETGTNYGGSAVFFASVCDLLDHGAVITIDTEDKWLGFDYPRITKIIGDSVSDEVIEKVKNIVGGRTAMVSLDSDHSKWHVLRELALYSQFVMVGGYMVVEDTNIHGHPVLPDWSEGPMEGVDEYFKTHDEFVVDRSRERFLVSFNPGGYLRRVK